MSAKNYEGGMGAKKIFEKSQFRHFQGQQATTNMMKAKGKWGTQNKNWAKSNLDIVKITARTWHKRTEFRSNTDQIEG